MDIALIYHSIATPEFHSHNLEEILAEARIYNKEHQINSCLLLHNNQFLQLIEGEESEVEALLEKVSEAKYHSDLKVIARDQIEGRLFRLSPIVFDVVGKAELSYLGIPDQENLDFAISDPTKAKELFSYERSLINEHLERDHNASRGPVVSR